MQVARQNGCSVIRIDMQVACQFLFLFTLTNPRGECMMYLMTNTITLNSCSVGARMLALALADCQRAGNVCAIVDLAGNLDTEELTDAGVNLADLLISQPDSEPQGREIADTILRTGAIDVLVVIALMPHAWTAELVARTSPTTTTIIVVEVSA